MSSLCLRVRRLNSLADKRWGCSWKSETVTYLLKGHTYTCTWTGSASGAVSSFFRTQMVKWAKWSWATLAQLLISFPFLSLELFLPSFSSSPWARETSGENSSRKLSEPSKFVQILNWGCIKSLYLVLKVKWANERVPFFYTDTHKVTTVTDEYIWWRQQQSHFLWLFLFLLLLLCNILVSQSRLSHGETSNTTEAMCFLSPFSHCLLCC